MDLVVIDTNQPDWLARYAALPADCVTVGGPMLSAPYSALRAQGFGGRAVFAFLSQLPEPADEGRTAWRFFTSNEDQISAVLGFAANELGIHSFGVLAPNDSYGQRMSSLFAAAAGRQGFASFERGITSAFWIIAAVELLSALTGTDPYTYPDKRIGLCGWFYFANSQSAILSMLVPLALCPALRSGQIRRWLPIAVVGFAELFCFATRLAYMSLFVTAIGMVITLALTKRGSAKVCAVLLLCAAVCAAGYTVSPIHRNQQAVAANAVRKQENIDRLVAQGKAEFGDQGYAYLTYAYDEYLGGTVERYGLEATAEMYGYSTKAADITNVRTIKINYCRLMLNTEPLTSRLFGLSYDEMTYHGYCYDVENDFHGIAYLYGWAGLACLLAFLGYFLVIIVCALIRNARRYFTVEAGACGVALCTALAHIYNTAGVLRRPNASFYLCLILASIWYLIYIRDYDDSKEN